MKYFKSSSQFVIQLIKRIPIELLLGILVSGWLGGLLSYQVWYAGTASVQPEIASWLNWRMLNMLLFVFLLALCARYIYLMRTLPHKVSVVIGLFIFGSYVGLFKVFYSHIIAMIFSVAQTERVANASLLHLQLDLNWSVYEYLNTIVAFFISHPVLYAIVDFCYTYTMHIASGLIPLLAFYSSTLARQYMMSGFISLLLCAPFWIVLPAIAPYQLAVTDTLDESSVQTEITVQSAAVLDLYATHADSQWGDTVAHFSDYWESATEFFGYAVSSNPSTHVILGVLMTIYLWRVHWIFGSFGLIFALLESVGTMLFLQHYLIDLPVGLLVGLMTPLVVTALYKFEKKHLSVADTFWFQPFLLAEQTGNRLVLYWKKQWSLFYK